MTYALMFAYASAFLQNKGFTNTQIGAVIGCAFILASVLQPVFARLFVNSAFTIEKQMGVIYILLSLLSFSMIFLVSGKIFLAACTAVVMGCHAALQPSLNSCVQRWNCAGCDISYGPARAVGSLAYAVTSFGFGMLIMKISPGFLPAFYGTSMLLFAIILLNIKLPLPNSSDNPLLMTSSAETAEDIGKRANRGKNGNFESHSKNSTDKNTEGNRGFVPVIAGICFLVFGHTIIDNYMLQILTNCGGEGSGVGIVVAIGSVVEIAAMILYDSLSRKFGDGKLLVLSAAAWLLKHLLTYLAKTPAQIYCIELLQFFGYAFYTPGIVSYVNKHFTGKENIRWLSLAGSAYTIGSILASFCGGYVLDAFGASAMLLVTTCSSAVGLAIFAVYFLRKRDKV